MRALMTAIGLSFALGACNPQPQAYPADYERNFVTACEAQGSPNALCACVWDRIEVNISPSDFAALERMPGPAREVHPLTAQISGYLEACRVDLVAPLPAADGVDVAPPP